MAKKEKGNNYARVIRNSDMIGKGNKQSISQILAAGGNNKSPQKIMRDAREDLKGKEARDKISQSLNDRIAERKAELAKAKDQQPSKDQEKEKEHNRDKE